MASLEEAVRFCPRYDARSVLVAHTHFSGNLKPSRADVTISRRLKAAGEAMGVDLVVGYDGPPPSLAGQGHSDTKRGAVSRRHGPPSLTG